MGRPVRRARCAGVCGHGGCANGPCRPARRWKRRSPRRADPQRRTGPRRCGTPRKALTTPPGRRRRSRWRPRRPQGRGNNEIGVVGQCVGGTPFPPSDLIEKRVRHDPRQPSFQRPGLVVLQAPTNSYQGLLNHVLGVCIVPRQAESHVVEKPPVITGDLLPGGYTACRHGTGVYEKRRHGVVWFPASGPACAAARRIVRADEMGGGQVGGSEVGDVVRRRPRGLRWRSGPRPGPRRRRPSRLPSGPA